jgi:hypothetical protein
MDSDPFLVPVLVNRECFPRTLADTGCLSYGLIDSRFAQKHNLKRIPIRPRAMVGFDAVSREGIQEIAIVRLDVDGHVEKRAFLYVVPRLASYDMILGRPWMKKNDVRIRSARDTMTIGPGRLLVKNMAKYRAGIADIRILSAAAFSSTVRTVQRKKQPVEVFAASLLDIEKALRTKVRTDHRKALPNHFGKWTPLFDPVRAEQLPPLRGPSIDHAIHLEQENGKDKEVPWGPLYNMSRDELLVLRKTLTELLDKGFIRVSSSPAAAPVLFVRKPGGGLRFCVDYRALNSITRKDRYPLPLIYETLRTIGQAKWFTKLDVSAAFYKIRVAEGDEWKTAFRTRYGLFEWLVTPFGLANAPSTFQKYINWALREYLDEFCSAYIDDVLIYTNGSRTEHREHVNKVLARLSEAGLQLDIDKCEFETKSTKYLGFIIEAGKGVRMDPEKVKAIQEWEAPKSVKGVQSFLGFANFYRKFIRDFSDIVRPLTSMTKKEQAFIWTKEAEAAFVRLKTLFTTAPVLAPFDHTRETIVETDSSGWCIGGTLLQRADDGCLHPCAYFSKKNLPAECNYEIYDKELMAIVRCLEEWDAELRSVGKFKIHSDHKSLEYFMTVRKLTERQMRWSLALSHYDFTIEHIAGKKNERADALSRREQDLPISLDDARIQFRTTQLLKPHMLGGTIASTREKAVEAAPANRTAPDTVEEDLSVLWEEAEENDDQYQAVRKAVQEDNRVFPANVGVKVSISECSLEDGKVLFRGRRWVPDSEPLRTKIIQQAHDSVMSGHPGRVVTAQILSRQFFWPKMLEEVRRFVRNCDPCHSNHAWRDRKNGFLKPLPVPCQIWKDISIDFIDKLPLSRGCTTLMVITDRLGKGVILEPCHKATAEYVAEKFVRCFYRHHGPPDTIVSDRGPQFTGILWTRVCKLLSITRRLSTAFHPETDGATERMNQNVEAYVRSFANYAQDDWADLMPFAELAINNHDSSTTGVSPFFLMHGYHVEPVQIGPAPCTNNRRISPVQKGELIVRKLAQAREWAQASMAVAQQSQEEIANRSRQQSTQFKVDDKVWLNLKNIRTDRPSKKFDAKNAKFTVTEVMGSHNYRLNTPPGIHNVFHSSLLRLAATDPLPSQRTTDSQPVPKLLPYGEEYDVEKILDTRQKKRGRGSRTEYLVKWVGYSRPTWEPEDALEDCAALDEFLATRGE